MYLDCFVEQIEWLLFTGAIEGSQILTLHRALQRYVKGTISEADMQWEIDAVDPDPEPYCWENTSVDRDWF